MHCNQCGKENREGSKFCRHCGAVLSEGSVSKANVSNITWTNPIVLILIGLIAAGVLFYGGSKAYAYYQVQSKIGTAKKLQSTDDFNGSLATLNSLDTSTLSSSDQNTVSGIKTNDQKYLKFQASFNTAVSEENASSSESLQSALASLQSITSDYPDYKDVQAEIVKVQAALVLALQGDANSSKAAVASANAAKAQAQEAAQKAQSEANTAAADAAETTTATAEKDFINQLQSAYTDFQNIAKADFDTGITDLNAGDYDVAEIWFAKSNSASQSTSQTANDIYNNYTNVPATYTTALYDLEQAAQDLIAANNSAIDDTDTYDTSATTNSDSAQSTTYLDDVNSFLQNPQ